MKFLLGILLSFIMMEAPVLALQGGYTLASQSPATGTYAGVLIPIKDTVLTPGTTDFGLNSLGLFTLGLPTTGIGAGTVVIFSNGQTYNGTIQALPDPANIGGIIGIINATFNYNLSETLPGANGAETVTTIAVTANAQGSFDAQSVSSSESSSPTGVNLDGTSEVNVDHGFVSGSDGTPIVDEQIVFQIEGFQQSTASSTQ
jgi:hypothetical protein